MRKRISVSNRPKMNFKISKVYILAGLCAVMAIASIYMTIEASTGGAEFASLQSKEAELVSKQNELQQTLVEYLSVNTLQEQSGNLGYNKVGNLVYLKDSGLSDYESVAKLP